METFEKVGIIVSLDPERALHDVFECQMCFGLVIDTSAGDHSRWHDRHPSTDGHGHG